MALCILPQFDILQGLRHIGAGSAFVHNFTTGRTQGCKSKTRLSKSYATINHLDHDFKALIRPANNRLRDVQENSCQEFREKTSSCLEQTQLYFHDREAACNVCLSAISTKIDRIEL